MRKLIAAIALCAASQPASGGDWGAALNADARREINNLREAAKLVHNGPERLERLADQLDRLFPEGRALSRATQEDFIEAAGRVNRALNLTSLDDPIRGMIGTARIAGFDYYEIPGITGPTDANPQGLDIERVGKIGLYDPLRQYNSIAIALGVVKDGMPENFANIYRGGWQDSRANRFSFVHDMLAQMGNNNFSFRIPLDAAGRGAFAFIAERRVYACGQSGPDAVAGKDVGHFLGGFPAGIFSAVNGPAIGAAEYVLAGDSLRPGGGHDHGPQAP